MTNVSAEVLQQLEQAQAQIDYGLAAGTGGPPVASTASAEVSSQPVFGAAGSATAKHVLLDHYFTSSLRRLWAHAGGAWRYRNVTQTEEQGLAQVAFMANRVDAWWDNNNVLTLIRCWKTF
jgi:hypothetical protein